MGAIHVVIKAIWIQHLMGELDFLVNMSIAVNFDNQWVIHVLESLVANNKMKHVEVHAYYWRSLIQGNVVNLVYCRKND